MTTDDLIYLIGLKEVQLQVSNLEINKLRQEDIKLTPTQDKEKKEVEKVDGESN
jgi:hypothetical protein